MIHQDELPSPNLKREKWTIVILIIGILYVATSIKLEKSYKVELIKTETDYMISLSITEFSAIKEIGNILINQEKYRYQVISVKEKENLNGVDVYLKLDNFSSSIDIFEGKIIISSSTILESIYQVIRKE
jgi:hypothetical protein